MYIVWFLFYLELGYKFIFEFEKGKYIFDRRKEGEREGGISRVVRVVGMKSI